MSQIPGYENLVCIYESRQSRVLRARRTDGQRPVILKSLKIDCPSTQELVHYRQEYRITNLLAGRRGVIETFGMGEHAGIFYIVLEDFGALSLKDWMEQRTFSLAEKLNLAAQMAQALQEVHAAGVIHKDINPSNAVYHLDTDTLKLIDFGISSELTRETPELQSPNVLEGTLSYLSPEQTGRMNRCVDYRTDFYSLGVTLYQLFTGRLPFATQDPMELVHCHLARKPEPPSRVEPAIPEMVSALILRLLAKTPEERYQSARGIEGDLGRCRDQLEEKGRVERFVLGERDLPERLVVPQKLYGRERALATLDTAFARVAAGGKEMTIVAGPSGVGKTALVQELYRPMTKRRGYFLAGKFDQLKRDQPYSALSTAFRQLIRHLLCEPDLALRQRQETLLAALGGNGEVMVKLIPELAILLGPQPPIEELGPAENQNRFNYVFRSFMVALCAPGHPLILFIDDLQWADSASLKLLRLIMTAPELSGVHLVAAYRDSEVNAAHPWSQTVRELHEAGCHLSEISLSALDSGLVNELLAAALHRAPQETTELAALVFAKTQGNPFFVGEFLHTLEAEGLIRLDRELGAWKWNLQEIAALGVTENVVELMAERIRKFQPDTTNTLLLAACIGNQFDLRTLSVIAEASPEETLARLGPSIRAGYLLPSSNEYRAIQNRVPGAQDGSTVRFAFAHDRIQQAAYSLTSGEQQTALHQRIGALLEQAGADVFDIVNHLNHAAGTLTGQGQREHLAALNLQAARRAKAASAHEQAVPLLQIARDLLGDDGWTRCHELTREVCEEAAETAYLTMDYEKMEASIREVELHAKSLLEKARMCELRILWFVGQNQPVRAIEAGLSYLAELGFKLDPNPSRLTLAVALVRVKWRLWRQPIAELENLPAMRDPLARISLTIMERMCAAAFFCRPELLFLMACKGVELTLAKGQSSDSTFMLLIFGLVLGAFLGDMEQGYQIASQAMRMTERQGSKRQRCRNLFAFNAFVRFWKEPFKDTIPDLMQSFQLGIDAGDFEYAAYALANHHIHRGYQGQQITTIVAEFASAAATLQKMGQEIPLGWLQVSHQFITTLMGRAQDPTLLGDDVKKEREMLAALTRVNQQTGIAAFYYTKLVVCAYFQEFEQAFACSEKTRAYLPSLRGTFNYFRYFIFDSLTCAEICLEAKGARRFRLLRRVRRNQRKLSKWARLCPTNHLHMYWLIEAELLQIRGKAGQAIALYQKAIDLAHKNGWYTDEAMSHELLARCYLSRREEDPAVLHLQAARTWFLKSGSLAKVRQMNADYQLLLAAGAGSTLRIDSTIRQRGSTTTTATSAIDLASVIKASQSISQEVEQEQLLNRLMHIALENAGATKGVLILHNDGALGWRPSSISRRGVRTR